MKATCTGAGSRHPGPTPWLHPTPHQVLLQALQASANHRRRVCASGAGGRGCRCRPLEVLLLLLLLLLVVAFVGEGNCICRVGVWALTERSLLLLTLP